VFWKALTIAQRRFRNSRVRIKRTRFFVSGSAVAKTRPRGGIGRANAGLDVERFPVQVALEPVARFFLAAVEVTEASEKTRGTDRAVQMDLADVPGTRLGFDRVQHGAPDAAPHGRRVDVAQRQLAGLVQQRHAEQRGAVKGDQDMIGGRADPRAYIGRRLVRQPVVQHPGMVAVIHGAAFGNRTAEQFTD
jgi:hypothetical protein